MIGLITICMAKEFTLGLMAEDMRVTTKWIRNMDTENINGLTADSMKVIGSTESNTVKVIIFLKTEQSK